MNARNLSRALAAAGITVLAGACGGGGGGGGSPNVRIIDAAYQATSNFDVLVNSASTAMNLAYGQATAFQAVGTGSVSVEFEPTGTTTNARTATFVAQDGFNYSVIAVEGSSTLDSIVVAQGNAAVATGQSAIAIVDADPAQSAIDVFVSGPTADLPVTPSIAGVSYGGGTAILSPAALMFSSGTYRVRAIASGDTARTVLFDSGPIALASGAGLLLAVVPVSGSASAFALQAIGADSSTYPIVDQRVLLRAGNFALAIAGVDAYLDPAGTGNVGANLFFSSIVNDGATAYSAVFPGSYRASYTLAGQTAEIAGTPFAPGAGTSTSVFLAGISGQISAAKLQVLAFADDLGAPPTGMANLRILALAPDLGAVDVVLVDPTGTLIQRYLATDLAYTGSSAYVQVATGSVLVALVPTGATQPLLPASGPGAVSLNQGSVNTLVIAGCRYPGSGTCAASSSALHLVALQDN